ncbi:hypothetical protein LTR02_008061 [Friedmanniomyces endolithicus]|nr:hypothetical protein LTR38_007394 [Friedmanniomyces endolithicus]KAK0802327.1 hypothetical protein LTR59_005063 [Friedmanniomyces endolithicus]KAK0837112.1 hypothetical protein LTR03_013072 [Friedmanniomyces endolithicus]KAK0902492.1 hypothetical protein LTR02_008061 [Friedmanniomyces endolithicus]KAK1022566.1 hypothetical protein LTS16_025623 [Friedmanniomyces endolithicus]
MHSLVKLLAVYLAVGQNQFGNAVPVDARSCELNEAVGLSLRDPAFAEEWNKRCAQPDVVLQKRVSPSTYGGESSSSTTSTKPTSTKETSTSTSSKSYVPQQWA